ncbi:DUF4232 domain-containing protein [Rhodococcus kronopolitis]|uniref:DUF4232 domain-containing protein n=1 Tax=Rhodococcus kronopolitis TaxID=1460226 RepID=A0ABV9FX61_9NOCA
MTRFRTAALLAAAAALTLAGCSSTDTSPTAEPTPPTTTVESLSAPESPAADPATATAAAPTEAKDNPNTCASTELMLTAGQAQGAAGSAIVPLVFTNSGGRTCELHGFPGVSYVAEEHGAEVGAAAARSGEEGPVVQLAPGATASAQVRAIEVANYPAEMCGPTPVAGLRVFPPNSYAPLFLPYPTTGCAMTGPGVFQLEVTTVAAGG